MIVLDSKYLQSTGFTRNQNAAMLLSNYYIKTEGVNIKGPTLSSEEFIAGAQVIKNGNFLKIFSDGNGNFSNIQ